MSKIRCRLNFHRPKVGTLITPAKAVSDGVYGHPMIFPTPTLPMTDFQLLRDNYSNTWTAYKYGGIAQQGAYRAAESSLIAGMDTLADYVNTIADGQETIITTAGFSPTKGTASVGPEPVQLQDIVLTRGATGELYAECENQDAAAVYICIISEGAPLPAHLLISDAGQMAVNGKEGDPTPLPTPGSGVIDFNKGRKKKFMGLTVGMHYYFVFFVINARGVGPLSLPVSIICV